MFGKCKCCPEKDARIADLKEQLEYFKKLLSPPPRINKYELQEDMIMSGAGSEEIDPSQVEAEELENARIQKESDFIFSGNAETLEV